MPPGITARLAAIVDALPLAPASRVLEIGCGSGAAARAVARKLDSGRILAIDRSAKAVALDGRHPDPGRQAIARIRAALAANGRVFIDGGQPLRELDVTR